MSTVLKEGDSRTYIAVEFSAEAVKEHFDGSPHAIEQRWADLDGETLDAIAARAAAIFEDQGRVWELFHEALTWAAGEITEGSEDDGDVV